MPVPNQFANVTTSIPLSQLDANFNTPITLGNTAIQLGNTVTTLNNMTLANVTISSGNVTLTNVSVTTANVTTANITTAVIGTANVTTGNITTAVITTANVATANVTTSQILNYGTANQVQYLNASKALTGSSNLTFDGTTLTPNALTVTNNLTVNGNTTLGDASTDTVLMTAAPSIGGAGLGMGFGFRNRIINGAMVIDQRNAGASVTPIDGQYSVDRWRCGLTQTSKFSVQQNSGSVTPPVGFTNYLGVVSLSAYTPTGNDVFMLQQKIEGFNVADLSYGTANAATVTISFWVRSSLTGSFGGSIVNNSFNRSYSFSYSISSANTWEQKTITVAGDTSGTWLTNSGSGLELRISLGGAGTYLGTANVWAASNLVQPTGSVNLVATNGATFYITGVQLEKGSTATSFDYRPYGTELMLCQRYFQFVTFLDGGLAVHYAPGGSLGGYTQMDFFPVAMRAAPTGTFSQVGVLKVAQYTGVADGTTTGVTTATTDNSFKAVYSGTGYSGSTTTPLSLYMGNSKISFSAEL